MDAVEEVKTRLNIEDVIGEYVVLKRAGRNFKGLSPFGNEKTPSFVVSPEKQIWHDFSSGKGGNLFSFVMEMEGLDFKGALELLARKAGVDLEQYKGRGGGNAEIKDRLRAALALATKFYQVQFSHSKIALDYVLKQRRFSKQTALTFMLGYSPNNGTALYDFMRKHDFNDEELRKAGLITNRYSGAGDMFRGRLMIPLQDATGSVIGFTARLLEDGPPASAPKYINTPATLLYDKSRHVYGLHLAKDQIRRSGHAVLVEGNLDVIASHQAGVSNVVATAGTALTEDHLKTIGRLAGDIRLSFDADKAGVAATERAIPIASKVGVSLYIVALPDGKDPDDLIKNKPGAWEKAIEKPQYAVDWLIERYKQQTDLTSGQGKRELSDKLLPTIRALKDPVEQDHYLNMIAEITGVSIAAMNTKFNIKPTSKPLRKKNLADRIKTDQMHLEWAKTQDHLLALALMRPGLRDQLELLNTEMLPQASGRQLLEYLQAHPDFDKNGAAPPPGDSASEQQNQTVELLSDVPLLQNIADYVKIVALQYEALFIDLDEHEARYTANRLRIRLIEMFVRNKKSAIAVALHDADEATAQKLLARAKDYDMLLKTSQEVI